MVDTYKISRILDSMEYPEPYENIIVESLHQNLTSVLNADSPIEHKFTRLTRAIRDISKRNEDTGLEKNTPAKGSSRAVFFPKQEKKITIDGKEASVPSVVKVAFAGPLDKFTGHHSLLGEEQNRIESDHFINGHYSVLRETHEPNKYEYNPEGILPPHFGHHDEHHWLEMGRVSKLNSSDFKEATKTDQFPKGITMKQFTDTVSAHHDLAHGRKPYSLDKEKFDKLSKHPLVENMVSFMVDASIHPGDFSPRNMGIWTHPHTGKKHVVLSDFGSSNEILGLYDKARKNRYGRW